MENTNKKQDRVTCLLPYRPGSNIRSQTVKQPREGLRNECERSHHGSTLVPHGIISVVLNERRYIPGGSASEHLPLSVLSVY